VERSTGGQGSGTFWAEDESKRRVVVGSASGFARATADAMRLLPGVGGVGARVSLPQCLQLVAAGMPLLPVLWGLANAENAAG